VQHDVLVVERRPGRALPADGAALHQFGEEVGLLLEQALVVGEVVAEERERLDARAAAEDHLGPSAGDRVQGRVALEDADGIVGAEHDHCRAEMNSGRARGDGGENDVAGGHREVVGVVLADAEEVDADPVGEHALVDEDADRFRVRQRSAGLVVDQVAERVEAEHERERHGRAVFGASVSSIARALTARRRLSSSRVLDTVQVHPSDWDAGTLDIGSADHDHRRMR
jgi:hypothetical protein